MKTQTDMMPEITLKYKASKAKKFKMASVSDVHDYIKNIKNIFDNGTIDLYETFAVIFLNRSLESIGWIRISQGGMSGTVVDQRLIFSTALKCAASGIITVHNHPSGNLSPSEQDIKICKQTKEAASFFNIELIDNLILTNSDYFSFLGNGIL